MPIVKIALAGIALGVCVMLLSILIITGFKNEITTKLSGFMAHLSITAYDHEDANRSANATIILPNTF